MENKKKSVVGRALKIQKEQERLKERGCVTTQSQSKNRLIVIFNLTNCLRRLSYYTLQDNHS